MKTLVITMVTAGLFAGLVAGAEPPTNEKKLQGDELAKFYLQQILDQAADSPITAEQRNLLEELQAMVSRRARMQEELAKQKLAEQREAEAQAAASVPAVPAADPEEPADAVATGKRDRTTRQETPVETPAGEGMGGPVVTFKPVIVGGSGSAAVPAGAPPMSRPRPLMDPAVRPAGAEVPVREDGNASADAAADTAPQQLTREQIHALIRLLDEAINRMEAFKAKLAVVANLF